MTMRFFLFGCLLTLATFLQSGCGGREATVVQPVAAEPEDLSAEAAAQHPDEYAKMNQQ